MARHLRQGMQKKTLRLASVPLVGGFIAVEFKPDQEIQVKRLIIDGMPETVSSLVEFGVLLVPSSHVPIAGDEADPDYHIIGTFANAGQVVGDGSVGSVDRPFTIRVKKNQSLYLYASSWVGSPTADVNARLWVHYLEF